MLTKEAAIHLLISILFNQSCDSRMAFKAPSELLKRLGQPHFDLVRMELEGYGPLFDAIRAKPCLHRYTATMASNLYESIRTVNAAFGADPRNLWQGKAEDDILRDLMTLRGVGRHKAIQCLIYLEALGEIHSVSDAHLEYMAKSCERFFANLQKDLKDIVRLATCGGHMG